MLLTKLQAHAALAGQAAAGRCGVTPQRLTHHALIRGLTVAVDLSSDRAMNMYNGGV